MNQTEAAMQTLNWNNYWLQTTKLEKPVRVYQPNSYLSSYYTAIPLDMLDSVRAMLKACGYKLQTFYVGFRPADSRLDEYYRKHGHSHRWSVTAGTTRRENARYAKILVEDPKTKKRMYL